MPSVRDGCSPTASTPSLMIVVATHSLTVVGSVLVSHHRTETLPCPSTLPDEFPTIAACHCISAPFSPPPIPEGKQLTFESRLLQGVNTTFGQMPRGFPTLRSVTCARRHEAIGVNVFGWASRNETVVITLNTRYVLGYSERARERECVCVCA